MFTPLLVDDCLATNGPHRKHHLQQVCCCITQLLHGPRREHLPSSLVRVRNLLPNNGRLHSHYLATTLHATYVVPRAVLLTSVIGLVSEGDYCPTAPSLRPLIPSGSLIRCEPVQVYHHQPYSRVPFRSVRSTVPRVVDALISLAFKLLVLSFLRGPTPAQCLTTDFSNPYGRPGC
jgi:hypothetical protein